MSGTDRVTRQLPPPPPPNVARASAATRSQHQLTQTLPYNTDVLHIEKEDGMVKAVVKSCTELEVSNFL